jgi:LmbE family N-acetylglucosaminyl deacetylase
VAGLEVGASHPRLGERLSVIVAGGERLPISRILCLGAHSDDIEIGCGGTVLKLLDEHPGTAVDWVVLSATGDREREAQSSAERFLERAAERHVTIADFRERYFPYDGPKIKAFFDDLGARPSPDLVLAPHRHDAHQDHRTVAELAANTFREHLVLEYEIPKYDGDLGQPNIFVHLDADHVARKVAILTETFATQHGRPWFSEETFRSILRIRGIEARSPSGYAEAFHSRRLVLA